MKSEIRYSAVAFEDEGFSVSGTAIEDVARQLVDGIKNDDGVWLVPPQEAGSNHVVAVRKIYWVPCVRGDEGAYDVPAEYPGDAVAISFGPRWGWSVDMMIDQIDFDDPRIEAAHILADIGTEPIEYMATIEDHGAAELALHEGRGMTFKAPDGNWPDDVTIV